MALSTLRSFLLLLFFFSSRRRHTRFDCDWSSDVCSSDLERWHQVMAINLTGVWLCMKYEIAQMLTQGGGTIVNTASDAGLVGLPYASAYRSEERRVGKECRSRWSPYH